MHVGIEDLDPRQQPDGVLEPGPELGVVAHERQLAMPLTMRAMDPRLIARLLVAGRLAAGASLVLFPDRAAALMMRGRGGRPAARRVLRVTGIRDLVLASGLLAALRGRGPVRRWALAGAAADALDLSATVAIRDRLQPRAYRATVAAAGGGVVQGLLVARAPD
jgi:hypothetical protein